MAENDDKVLHGKSGGLSQTRPLLPVAIGLGYTHLCSHTPGVIIAHGVFCVNDLFP